MKSTKENFQPLSRKSLYNINKDGLKLVFTGITPADVLIYISSPHTLCLQPYDKGIIFKEPLKSPPTVFVNSFQNSTRFTSILNPKKNKEAILAHQEGGVRRRDVRLIGTGSSIHKLDFEDELEKRILALGFTKDHPPSAILEFGIENLRQIAFQEWFIFDRRYQKTGVNYFYDINYIYY